MIRNRISPLEAQGWTKGEPPVPQVVFAGRTYTMLTVSKEPYWRWGFCDPPAGLEVETIGYFYYDVTLEPASEFFVDFVNKVVKAGGSVVQSLNLPLTDEEISILIQGCRIWASLRAEVGDECRANEILALQSRIEELAQLI